MHLFDKKRRFYGGNAIVGGGLPLATGLAFANKKLKRDSVAVCFFGEGAVAEGEFHEAMNLAVLWQLPVLFVCENNGYAMGTALSLSESQPVLINKAASYGMAAEQVDGMNVIDVESVAKKAIAAIHATGKPYFLECKTYRFRGHSSFDGQLYRDKAEVKLWQEKGPVVRLKQWLIDNNHFDDAELVAMDSEIKQEVADAIAFADEGEWEDVADLCVDVYSPSVAKQAGVPS